MVRCGSESTKLVVTGTRQESSGTRRAVLSLSALLSSPSVWCSNRATTVESAPATPSPQLTAESALKGCPFPRPFRNECHASRLHQPPKSRPSGRLHRRESIVQHYLTQVHPRRQGVLVQRQHQRRVHSHPRHLVPVGLKFDSPVSQRGVFGWNTCKLASGHMGRSLE